MFVRLVLRTCGCIKIFYLSDTPIVDSEPILFQSTDPSFLEDLIAVLPFVTESWSPLIQVRECVNSSPAFSS
ncbi:8 kDa protein [polyscias crinivirus 1]|nr:8 kDa protein [polyscias crinivirus 1]